MLFLKFTILPGELAENGEINQGITDDGEFWPLVHTASLEKLQHLRTMFHFSIHIYFPESWTLLHCDSWMSSLQLEKFHKKPEVTIYTHVNLHLGCKFNRPVKEILWN